MPWCRSWWKLCCPFVPGSPQMIGAGVDADRLAGDRHALPVRLHHELLQVRREATQVRVVRQHRVRLRAEAAAVPDTEQPHQDRQVLGEGGRAEVLVDGMEAVEQVAEAGGADREHRREPDGRSTSTAHPVPEAEGVGGVDPERRDRLEIRGHRDDVQRDGAVPERTDEPRSDARALAIVSAVVKVFETTTASVSAVSGREAPRRRPSPSTLDTNRNVRSRLLWALSAS